MLMGTGVVAPMSQEIPVTYVPARNTILLSFALAWAEVLGAADIFLGVNALDYSGYPDCRPEYIAAYERMAQAENPFIRTTTNAYTTIPQMIEGTHRNNVP